METEHVRSHVLQHPLIRTPVITDRPFCVLYNTHPYACLLGTGWEHLLYKGICYISTGKSALPVIATYRVCGWRRRVLVCAVCFCVLVHIRALIVPPFKIS
jgi:hypothetical protein